MREVEPRIRAEIARAMAEARPEIRRAIAEAHISEKVMKALHDAQPKIDAAMRRAQQEQRHIEIIDRNSDDEAPLAPRRMGTTAAANTELCLAALAMRLSEGAWARSDMP